MLFTHSFILIVTLVTLPLTTALFSFNSSFPSNGITITNQSFNGTISPSVLTDKCAAAYSASVNCSNSLVFVGPTLVNYTTVTSTSIAGTAFATLYRDVCTLDCYASLQQWRENLVGSCENDFDKLFSNVSLQGDEEPDGYLKRFELPSAEAGADVLQFGGAYVYTEYQWLDWIFWEKCLQDLNTTSYCSISEPETELTTWPSTEAARYSHLTKEEAMIRNQTFCEQASCFMQYEMISVVVTGMFQGENATVADVINRIEDVCSNINATSSFPFLQLGVIYPFDNVDKKITTDSVSTTDSRGADGIVDLSAVNSTQTSGSSTMSMPMLVSGKLLHLGCFVVVVGAAILF